MNCAILTPRRALAAPVRPSIARVPQVQPARGALVISNAHKKGAGSTKNGRDSNSKARGIKVYGGQPVKPGGIIVRQLGNKVSVMSARERLCMYWCSGGAAARAEQACLQPLLGTAPTCVRTLDVLQRHLVC